MINEICSSHEIFYPTKVCGPGDICTLGEIRRDTVVIGNTSHLCIAGSSLRPTFKWEN